MKLLCIDTANEYLSLALTDKNGDIITTFQEKIGNKQSEYILPSIQNLLDKNHTNLSQLDGVAYNMGPGSFTGLRIGLSIAMGIAYANNINLYPVHMFQIMASELKNTKKNTEYSLIVLDARLEQIYVALIKNSDMSYIITPCLIAPENLTNLLTQFECNVYSKITVTGNGWSRYISAFDNIANEINYVHIEYPSAKNMSNFIKETNLAACCPHNAELLYIRDKVALTLVEQVKNKSL